MGHRHAERPHRRKTRGERQGGRTTEHRKATAAASEKPTPELYGAIFPTIAPVHADGSDASGGGHLLSRFGRAPAALGTTPASSSIKMHSHAPVQRALMDQGTSAQDHGASHTVPGHAGQSSTTGHADANGPQTDQASLAAKVDTAAAKGLQTDKEGNETTSRNHGITKKMLVEFRESQPGKNSHMFDVVQKIKEETPNGRGYALEKTKATSGREKEPNTMVSHSWGGNFNQFMKALTDSAVPDDEVLWVCTFSNYQKADHEQDRKGPKVGDQLAQNPFVQIIQGPKTETMKMIMTSGTFSEFTNNVEDPSGSGRQVSQTTVAYGAGDIHSRIWCIQELMTGIQNTVLAKGDNRIETKLALKMLTGGTDDVLDNDENAATKKQRELAERHVIQERAKPEGHRTAVSDAIYAEGERQRALPAEEQSDATKKILAAHAGAQTGSEELTIKIGAAHQQATLLAKQLLQTTQTLTILQGADQQRGEHIVREEAEAFGRNPAEFGTTDNRHRSENSDEQAAPENSVQPIERVATFLDGISNLQKAKTIDQLLHHASTDGNKYTRIQNALKAELAKLPEEEKKNHEKRVRIVQQLDLGLAMVRLKNKTREIAESLKSGSGGDHDAKSRWAKVSAATRLNLHKP